jgi:hypothetical protein
LYPFHQQPISSSHLHSQIHHLIQPETYPLPTTPSLQPCQYEQRQLGSKDAQDRRVSLKFLRTEENAGLLKGWAEGICISCLHDDAEKELKIRLIIINKKWRCVAVCDVCYGRCLGCGGPPSVGYDWGFCAGCHNLTRILCLCWENPPMHWRKVDGCDICSPPPYQSSKRARGQYIVVENTGVFVYFTTSIERKEESDDCL